VTDSDVERYVVYAHGISFSKGLSVVYVFIGIIDTSMARILTRRLRS